MTWEEWCNSEYNTDEYFVDISSICKIKPILGGGYYKIKNVKYTDIIISNYSYEYDRVHSGGSN